MSDFYRCLSGNIRLEFGDMTAVGWLVTVAYAIAVLLAGLAAAGGPGAGDSRAFRRFWQVATLLLLLLGLNKQLDLQTSMMAAAKCAARLEGWYGQRRLLQAVFVGGLAAAVVLVAVMTFAGLRAIRRSSGLAIAGTVLLLLFILTRAAVFNHADKVLDQRLLLGGLWHALELAGVLLIAFNAASLVYRRRAGARRG